MFEFSEFLVRAERRARRMRAARATAIAVAVGAALLLAVSVARLVAPVSIADVALLYGAVAVLLAGACAFVLGWRLRVDLPRLLLRIDVAAGTEERLSSLYELRQRNGPAVLRSRIERGLTGRSIDLRQGVPLGRRALVLFSGGALGLLLAGGLVALPMGRDGNVTAATQISAARAPDAAPELLRESEEGAPALRTSEADALRTDIEAPTGEEGRSPDDALEAALGLSQVNGALDGAAAPIVELLAAQGELLADLAEILDALEEAAEQAAEGLMESLEELASRLPASALRDAVEELAAAGEGDGLAERIDAVKEAMAEQGLPPEAGDPDAASEGGESMAEPEFDLWSPPEPEGDGADPAGDGTSRQGNEGGQREAGEPVGEDEDAALIERMLGGDEGRGDEAESFLERKEPAFYDAEIEGRIGLDGEFEEFVTRGVPLEPASGDVGRSGRVVDYDALRAILDQRGLDAQERQLIERYFEAIAQGEQ